MKAMEVDEKPTEEYGDIGGCDKQIQELIEAVVLPMTHKDMFDAIGCVLMRLDILGYVWIRLDTFDTLGYISMYAQIRLATFGYARIRFETRDTYQKI